MVRLFISLFLLANLINYSYSTKDSITDTVNSKLDEILLEIKNDVNREIVKDIFNTIKSIDYPLELGDHDMYIKDKPFIEERIRQNFKVIGLLSSQINNNLRPFISQVLRPTRTPEDTIKNKHNDQKNCYHIPNLIKMQMCIYKKLQDSIKKEWEEINEKWKKKRPPPDSYEEFEAKLEKIRNERIERERKEEEEKRAQDEKYRESYGDAKYFI
uniref:Uncharacterized protein n=1 Tax=Strongyloides venezuelensis TaxID=75913 RepID=A0A0K0FDB5_STRVS